MASFVLHIVSLCVAAILPILIITSDFINRSGHFGELIFIVLHPVTVVPIVIIFILHFSLTIGFWYAIKLYTVDENCHLERLRTIYILSFFFILAVLPILNWGLIETMFITRNFTASELTSFFSTRNAINIGLSIRTLSMSLLLIATSMSWYYCFTKKNKDANINTNL